MTTIAFPDVHRERPTLRLAIRMPDILWAYLRRRAERRLFQRLSRLPPHVIRDAGFEPDAVYDAVQGTWDEVAPGRYRNR